jgi:hypothetical protein
MFPSSGSYIEAFELPAINGNEKGRRIFRASDADTASDSTNL